MFRQFPGAGTITTCHNCTERHPACHDTCERYITEKKERDAKVAEIRKNKRLSLELYHHKIEKMRQEDKKHKYK